ncbi:MAG: flagellar hook protein FlgE [Gammaproteobacteria bacterium]|nr:flagellar hook protein FlgE [Gammaproteobacteria bacterium]
MSFNISLSGLNAASSELSVTSNNIANVGTVGFKESRAEFADIYASSTLGNSKSTIGSGVSLSTVAQQFGQGNLEFTQNSLDLAISGEGFFVLTPDVSSSDVFYSRAGAFQLDSDGYIVNSDGDLLQAFPVDATGAPTSTSLSSTIGLQVPDAVSTPQATTNVNLNVSLPSDVSNILPNFYLADEAFAVTSGIAASSVAPGNDPEAASLAAASAAIASIGVGADSDVVAAITNAANNAAAQFSGNTGPDAALAATAVSAVAAAVTSSVVEFDPSDPNQYHYSTSVTVYDSQGSTHIASTYFMMTDDQNNTWETRVSLDGVLLDPVVAEVIDFDQNGNLDQANSSTAGVIAYQPYDLSIINGSAPLNLSFDYTDNGSASTQEVFGVFSVQALTQDGYSTGRLSGLDISDTGVVRANFSNGQQQALGQIALVKFDNAQGLAQLGNTTWAGTIDSGIALAGQSGSGTFGLIHNGALEQSNVDLTQELVKLITAQRNFQANSKAIETANTITQTIINIR